MYCANCGAKSTGRFCSACGAKLVAVDKTVTDNWMDESRYGVLLHFDEVRDLIAQHAGQARTGLSGEEFLELCDKAFVPIVGVSLGTVASIVVPIYSRLGMQTGKSRGQVEAATKIPGQLFDWGKSTQCLNHLYEDLEGDLV